MQINEVEKQKWGPFFNLIVKSKLPWKWYILNLLFSFALTTVSVKLPQLAGNIMGGEIFDRQIVTTYIGVSLLLTIINVPTSIFASWIELTTDRKIQNLVWTKFIKMPISFFNKLNPTSLTSRVTSDTSQISYTITFLFTLVNIVYGLFLILKTIFEMSSAMVLALSVVIPWVILIAFAIGRFYFKAQHKMQERYANFTNFVTERLTNIRQVKSSGTEDLEVQQGYEVAMEHYRAQIYKAKVSFFSEPAMYSIESYCQAIILIYGGVLVSRGQLDMASLVTMFLYSQTISMYATQFVMFFRFSKEAQGATAKVSEILEVENEELARKKSFALPDEDIRFEGVSFRYDQQEVLSNLNFNIPKGEVTAIIGPSGSGKTTILNMLERFYEPNSGRIMFGNVPVDDINLDEWRNAMGYVAQSSPLLAGSIRDNIVYGLHREVKEEEVIRAAKLANAHDFIMKLPDGYDTDVGEYGSKLSGGERQRVAIARTVIKDPDYLLLDEATSNLDAHNEVEVQKALNNLMKGRTTIVVAHNIQTVKNADNIIVIDGGQVQDIGKHEELYHKDNSLYRKYFDLQFGYN